MTGFWRRIADRMRLRRRRPTPITLETFTESFVQYASRPEFSARIRNELAQLRAIRQDWRVRQGSPFDQWLAGGIFALEWVADPERCVPPSSQAVPIRAGIPFETQPIDRETPPDAP